MVFCVLHIFFINLKNHNTIKLQRKVNFTNTYLSIKIGKIYTFSSFLEALLKTKQWIGCQEHMEGQGQKHDMVELLSFVHKYFVKLNAK